MEIELNTIYNENCLDTMQRMPDSFIDLTVTSPPYDNLRKYNGYSFDFEYIAKELFRVTKQGGVVVWVVSDATVNGSETLTSFKQAIFFKEIGFNVHDTMIWQKDCIPKTHNRYENAFEYMFIFSKGKPKTFNPILKVNTHVGKLHTGSCIHKNENSARNGIAKASGKPYKEQGIKQNVWYYAVGYNGSSSDKIAFEHPAVFPEKLAEDHIISWSNEGETIYDCFGGSGTVAKMAHKWKRNWILSEISAEYCEIAKKRIAPYLAQQYLI